MDYSLKKLVMNYLNNFLLFFIFVNILFADPISRTRRTAITEAIEKVGPAVVSINVEKKRSSFSYDPFFGIAFPRDILPMQSSGSGVIISPDGYLLTNQHVIESAERITAILSGGDEYSAQLIGSDETTDLALLKLEGRKFPYAELGNSDDLLIGEWIIAMGNPFQLFSISNKPSASAGIISATHMDFGQQKSGKVFQDMIQTGQNILFIINNQNCRSSSHGALLHSRVAQDRHWKRIGLNSRLLPIAGIKFPNHHNRQQHYVQKSGRPYSQQPTI